MDPNQSDECPECPLCMELLEMDDIKFFPCTCGYQICRFCWHRLRTDENGLCPACRKPYTECPADYKPLTQEELQKIKQEKKQKELMRKQKVTENRKHLANVRVVQKNLVFVVGLSSRLADAEALKKMEYFGKFGKIHKVVINHTTSYAGSQGPSASAYVTYQRAEDALKAISQVNNIHVDGRTLKVSLGTTKYCSHFMKNQQCPKNDCMYLHELGDEAASFTKEEMQQGKHQEFEKKLQELYLGTGSTKNGSGGVGCSSGYEPPHSSGRRTHKDSLSETSNSGSGNAANSRNTNGRSSVTINGTCVNNNNSNNNSNTGSGSVGGGGYHTAGIQPLDSIVINPGEGWPSLHLVGTKDLNSSNGTSSGGGSSSGVSSASGSQSSVNSNTSSLSNQSKKSRKHNGSNGNVTNGSNCASSPRNTPTRDHQSSGRRARNDDSTSSSSGRSTAARVSPGPNCAASSESSTSSLSSVLSTTPPTSSPSDTTPSKHKHASRSPVSSHGHVRNKSQSPSRNSESQFINDTTNTSDIYNNDATLSSSNQIDTVRNTESEDTETNAVDEKYIELEKDSLRVEDLSTEKNEEESKETSGIESGDSSYPTSESNADPFYANIITSLNDVVDSQDVAPNVNVSSIRQDDWEVSEVNQQTDSDEVVHSTPNIWGNVTEGHKSIDDELGFDPFEETNKALAQDIMMEKEKEQQQRHQLHQQRQQQQSFHQLQLQQQQAEPQTGLKAFIGGGSASISAVTAARLPPPGFNGVTSLHNVSSNVSHNGVDVAKLLPLLSSINSSLGNSVSTPPPQINGLITNRVATGPPPGLGMLTSLSSHQQGVSNTTGGVSSVGTSTLLSGLDASAHALAPQQPGPPPGLSLPKQESFAVKELENVFPSMTSLNRMNSLNTLNSSNSLNPSISSFSNMNGLASLNPLSLSSLSNGGGSALNFRGVNAPQQQTTLNHLNAFSGINLASAQQQVTGNNVISNLFNFSQQQQQQPLQQQQQPQPQQQQQQQQPQQPPQQQLPQPSVLHQLALHSAQKGWGGNGNGAPDLTALDPAIVSSGQLTDSRSDSPPEWLRLMEAPASTWSTLLPSHTSNNATVPQHHPSGAANLQAQASLSSHQQVSLLQQHHHQQQLAALQQQQQQQQQQQLRQQQAVPSVWPPTSPPPGFSSLSPLHRAKLPHKIDNL